MKRIISLLLIIAMTFVLIISVSASESSTNDYWKTYTCYDYGMKDDLDPKRSGKPAELYTRMGILSDLSTVRGQSSIVWKNDPKAAGEKVAMRVLFSEIYQRKEHWTNGNYTRDTEVFFDFPACPANFSNTMIFNRDYTVEIPNDQFGFYFWKVFRLDVYFYYNTKVGDYLSLSDYDEASLVVVQASDFPS